MNYNSLVPSDGYPYYLDLAKEQNLHSHFDSMTTFELLGSIDETMAAYRYAPNKWSIKQIVGHITDHERIKMFRAFQLSRNIQVPLWGYDQNLLVEHSRSDELTLETLIIDLLNVRKASQSFLRLLSEKQLKVTGRVQQYEVSLHDYLLSVIGHEIHHIRIIQKKYLNQLI